MARGKSLLLLVVVAVAAVLATHMLREEPAKHPFPVEELTRRTFTNAHAADLTKVDRRLVPPAKWTAPEQFYALLVFGPQADTCAWLAIDGELLYVDRDHDGSLEDVEKVASFESLSLSEDATKGRNRTWVLPDAPKRWTKMKVELRVLDSAWLPEADHPQRKEMTLFMAAVRAEKHPNFVIAYFTDSEGRERMFNTLLSASPESAPVLYPDGPLTVGIVESSLLLFEFWRGAEQLLRIGIGTPGRGRATFCYVLHKTVPETAKPTVELRFPSRERSKALDPLRVESLHRC
jgi:hypothetical protein